MAAVTCFVGLPGTPWAAAQSCTTSITGKVYSPNGVDPLPNILVYVPTTAVQPLPSGVSTCAAASQLVSGVPLVSTTTAADGSFTLTNANLAGNQTIVIQAGKWRRQYSGVSVTACQTNTAPTLAMPQNQSQGDIPQIAISTGSSDAIECVLRKIGISDSEFTAPGGTGRISLYAGSESPGITTDAAGTTLPDETTLVSSQTALNGNDLTIFACQGTPVNPAAAVIANQNNVVSYANVGGRVFATHYSYVWLDNSTPFAATANWVADTTISSSTTVPIDATIDQTYAEGVVLANWLYDIGATPTKGQLPLYVTKKDQTGVNPPAQSWATLNDPAAGNPVMQFTFDTPLGATNTTGVNVAFTNTPAVFHPNDTADSVLVQITNASTTTAADSSLNLSITLPNGVTATSLAGVGGTGWVCSVATLTCNRSTPLAAGATDSVSLGLAVGANPTLGKNTVAVTIAGGGLSSTNQCGRVLFNEYHVETSSTGQRKFPAECTTTPMTPQEKFLEFSLYNLSNFVAPVSADTVVIQTTSTVTWATPAPIYYGTPLGTTQLNATATGTGTTTTAPGTFVYSPAAGTVLPVGTNTLNVTFTPTDPNAYTGSTGTTTITVLPDTTTTTLTSSPNPSVVGGNVTFTATVTGNAAAPVGTVYFYDGGTLFATAPLGSSIGDSAVATLNITTLSIGTHTITAVYNIPGSVTGTNGGSPGSAMPIDFGTSTSNPVTQNVQGTSTTVITGLVSPIDYGQIIGNSGIITVVGSSSGGTITVYINGTSVCVLPVSPGVQNVCPASTGAGYAPGTYNIYAVFSGDPLYAGSTSPTYQVQVVPDPTTTTVISSLNPSYFTNSVTFTATVTAPYAQPTGTVNFYDGSTLLGVGTLTAQSALATTATYSTSALAVGSHNITVSYAASTDFNASVSPTLVQVVQPPLPFNGAPGYTLTVTPINLDAPIGAGTPITVTIQEFNSYNTPIALSCSGLPTESTCGFTLSTVPTGGGTVTLYLTPAAPHNCGANPPYFVASSGTKSLVWMSSLVLCLFCVRRRRRLRGLVLTVAMCCLPLLNGCGTGCTDFGTKPGTYSITLTATPTSNPGPAGSPTGVQSQTITFRATL
jgi:hypothetical protein